jgi:hypothetical protein
MSLKDNLKKLYRIQNEIDELNEIKADLRQKIERQILGESLMGKRFNVGNRVIIYEEKEVAQNLTQAYIAETLYNYFGNQDEARRLFDYLLRNRSKSIKKQLEMRKKPDKKKTGVNRQ